MNSVAIDIQSMLEQDSSLSSSESISLYPVHVGYEPESPADVITIFETMGFPPQLTYNREERYEYPSIQIRVRSNSYEEGEAVCDLIKRILHGRANETWQGTFYALIACQNGPFVLDFDKNQRVRFVLNFNIQRR